MTAAQLIEALSQFDPRTEVLIFHCDNGGSNAMLTDLATVTVNGECAQLNTHEAHHAHHGGHDLEYADDPYHPTVARITQAHE